MHMSSSRVLKMKDRFKRPRSFFRRSSEIGRVWQPLTVCRTAETSDDNNREGCSIHFARPFNPLTGFTSGCVDTVECDKETSGNISYITQRLLGGTSWCEPFMNAFVL